MHGGDARKTCKLDYKHIENNETWDLIIRTCNNPDEKITDGYNGIMTLFDISTRIISTLAVLTAQTRWLGIVFALDSAPIIYVGKKSGSDIYKAHIEEEKWYEDAVSQNA